MRMSIQSVVNPPSLRLRYKMFWGPPGQTVVLEGIMDCYKVPFSPPNPSITKFSFLSEEACFLSTFLHTNPLQIIFHIPMFINLIESVPTF